jgi:MoxR-like ATPase
MIDSHTPDSSFPDPETPSDGYPAPTSRPITASDLFDDLFAGENIPAIPQLPAAPQVIPPVASPTSGLAPPAASRPPVANAPAENIPAASHGGMPTSPRTHAPRPSAAPPLLAPACPTSLADSGLNLTQICDLILKQLYLQGNLLGIQIARQARLPFLLVDEGLRFLKDEKCIEVASGELIGPASYRFNLTDLGRHRAREAFEQCRYVGPAPVSLEAYVKQCGLQAVAGTDCSPETLREAFQDLIIRPNLLEELGPAVCSGKSIFIYGPPGNGKTMIAKGLGRFLNNFGGDIYIPYAIHTEGSIITLFDPTLHETTDEADLAERHGFDTSLANPNQGRRQTDTDLRWRRIKRPVVITGGELTLDMLDLRYNRTSNFYTGPLHIKANGGVFLIDDFGRQIVSPRDLLNRWILPLEERIDYMTLATGKKFSVPFEQLIIFSTNLDPQELVDEAFLRRIRHKIKIGPPTRDLFTEIFQLCCAQRNVPYTPAAVDYLYLNFYDQDKPPRSSDPRDLLEIIQSICRFRNQETLLSAELMAESTERFFCQV